MSRTCECLPAVERHDGAFLDDPWARGQFHETVRAHQRDEVTGAARRSRLCGTARSRREFYRHEHGQGWLHFKAVGERDAGGWYMRAAHCRLQARQHVAHQAHQRGYGISRQSVHRSIARAYAEPQRLAGPLRDLVEDDVHAELAEDLRHEVEAAHRDAAAQDQHVAGIEMFTEPGTQNVYVVRQVI